MDITERYKRDKESVIQYYISEMLLLQPSDFLRKQLADLNNNNVNKFLCLFPIQPEARISDIRKSLKAIKELIPESLYEDAEDEVREIIEDYRWTSSETGRRVLQTEEWIKQARSLLPYKFPSAHIYIGRSFIDPSA